MTEQERARRNLNPTKEAVAAMSLWGKEYSEQSGGSMDFWDKLDTTRQLRCRELVDRILAAPERSVMENNSDTKTVSASRRTIENHDAFSAFTERKI